MELEGFSQEAVLLSRNVGCNFSLQASAHVHE
jgi:hypothetical protein